MKTLTFYSKRYAVIAITILLASPIFSQDFRVQHIQDDIGNTGGTNTSFTQVSSLNNAFALANNNRKRLLDQAVQLQIWPLTIFQEHVF